MILAVINVTPLTGVLDKYDNVIDIHALLLYKICTGFVFLLLFDKYDFVIDIHNYFVFLLLFKQT